MVRFVLPGSGLGLQFKAIRQEDQARFSAMIKRILQPQDDRKEVIP
jgi:hypothetical protein